MKIDTGDQTILSFCFRNFRGCNAGITDGKNLLNAPLKWTQVRDINTQFHDDLFRHLSNITVITASI
jgi:hypothetical protein